MRSWPTCFRELKIDDLLNAIYPWLTSPANVLWCIFARHFLIILIWGEKTEIMCAIHPTNKTLPYFFVVVVFARSSKLAIIHRWLRKPPSQLRMEMSREKRRETRDKSGERPLCQLTKQPTSQPTNKQKKQTARVIEPSWYPLPFLFYPLSLTLLLALLYLYISFSLLSDAV